MSDKTRNLLIGLLTVGIIAMTVAYAALSQTLNISGSAQVQGKSDSWNIHFAHITSASTATFTASMVATTGTFTLMGLRTVIPPLNIF